MLAACRFGEDTAWWSGGLPAEAWGRLAAIAMLGLAAGKRPFVPIAFLLAGAAAYFSGAGFADRLDANPAAVAPSSWTPCAWVEESLTAVVRVRARPRIGTGGRWSAPATVLAGSPRDRAAAEQIGEPVAVYLRGDGPPPLSGSLVAADLDLRRPARASVPGGFDTAAWLAGRGISATARLSGDRPAVSLPGGGLAAAVGARRDRLQDDLRSRLARGLPPREAAIAGGVLLGGGTVGELRDPFARLGLAHLFALSGLHVGILAGLGLLVLQPIGVSPAGKVLVLGPLLAAYVVLVDLPGSVVRAAGLVSLALLAPAVGRRQDSLRLLGLLLWVGVLWQPAALLDTGTRLSYLAAGGIVAGQRALKRRLDCLPGRRRALVGGVGVTVSAQIATLPEVARSFGYLPLAGPLANLLLVPVFGFAVTLLAAGVTVGLLWPWAGDGVLACAWLLLRPLETATALAAGGGAGYETGLTAWGVARTAIYAGLVAMLVGSIRRRTRRALAVAGAAYVAILVLAAWRTPSGGGVEAWQFAVGQGDAGLIRLPDGWTCIVDTGDAWRSGGGPLARDVLPFLRRHGIRRLDAAILTHGHADHTGGSEALVEAVDVATWYVSGSVRGDRRRQLRPVAGDTLHAAADWALVCLHPAAGDTGYAHENDHSVVLGLCRDGELRGLWTGDLEERGERDLLRRLPPVPAAGLDVLKAGHHGSTTSSSRPFLERLRPQLVVISCGVANRHGHPSHGAWIAAAETLATVRTDLQGTVHLRWNRPGKLAVRAMRPLPPPPTAASLDTP